MDQLQTRLDALEQQMHTMNRRLRWWRGLAGGLLVLAMLTWALPLSTAQQTHKKKNLEERVAALEDLLKHFSREGNEVFITGANLHIVNGLGSTDCLDEQGDEIRACPNGLGNLIVGYNEPREFEENIRTGSHNVVVGVRHNFSRWGGLVVGRENTISGDFASVSGGDVSTASGFGASVSGGQSNTASGDLASVSGGFNNIASGFNSTISGGNSNTASGSYAVVSGGNSNTASGAQSSISGGAKNTASGILAVVSGGGRGFDVEEPGNTASGDLAVVSGGVGNTASGFGASVSGGSDITQEAENGWSAGSEADEGVVGNFRSP
jgi:hypothetical protein